MTHGFKCNTKQRKRNKDNPLSCNFTICKWTQHKREQQFRSNETKLMQAITCWRQSRVSPRSLRLQWEIKQTERKVSPRPLDWSSRLCATFIRRLVRGALSRVAKEPLLFAGVAELLVFSAPDSPAPTSPCTNTHASPQGLTPPAACRVTLHAPPCLQCDLTVGPLLLRPAVSPGFF